MAQLAEFEPGEGGLARHYLGKDSLGALRTLDAVQHHPEVGERLDCRLGFARRIEGAIQALNHALEVGEGAFEFRISGNRNHLVSHLGGFADVGVQHQQVVQGAEAFDEFRLAQSADSVGAQHDQGLELA